MTPEEIRHLIASTVHAADPSAEVILYGSRARGDARPDSDWDVLILLNKDEITFLDAQRIVFPLFNIGREAEQQVSPKLLSRNEWNNSYFTPFFKNVTSEGIRL